jgi:hypothetical protein
VIKLCTGKFANQFSKNRKKEIEMGIFHYKGVLQRSSTEKAVYTYQPEYISAEKVIGEFELDLKNWDAEIIIEANAEEPGIFSTDERCISALRHKIKKHFEETGKLPEKVYFVA